jgi:hypothetical protein
MVAKKKGRKFGPLETASSDLDSAAPIQDKQIDVAALSKILSVSSVYLIQG